MTAPQHDSCTDRDRYGQAAGAAETTADKVPVTIDPRFHDAVLFDLDGVVTDSAALHARTWARLFDRFLAERPARPDEDHRPFTDEDYRSHLDGKPRLDGIRDFLLSRGIAPQVDDRVIGELAERKQQLFTTLLADGVAVFDSTIALVHRLRDIGIATAVYSSSRNCVPVLDAAGIADIFAVRVDGVTAAAEHLPGKPHPALLWRAAHELGVRPDRCVIVEDARAGVTAGRDGGFGLVIGIARHGDDAALAAAGADVTVDDAADIVVRAGDLRMSSLPDALASIAELESVLAGRAPAVFIDFDGTLSDIVGDPAHAALVAGAAEALIALSRLCPVAVVSGRELGDIRDRVGVAGLWYAGSHGLDIVGPDGEVHRDHAADEALSRLRAAVGALRWSLRAFSGILVEDKRSSVAVHFRNVADHHVAGVQAVVRSIARQYRLRVTPGRKVVELHPGKPSNKGDAVEWIIERLQRPGCVPIYLGDDLTDEDGFDAVKQHGIGILVRHDEDGDRCSAASFALGGCREVITLLKHLRLLLQAGSDADSHTWHLEFEGYRPASERLREVLCTTGNGYMATRGAAPECTAGQAHYPGTYAAGLYNRLTDTVDGVSVSNESLVNLPNWLPFTIRADGGQWFDVDSCELLAYRQTMDIRHAECIRQIRFRDEAGRCTSMMQRRFTSMHNPHVGALQTILVAENWSGTIDIRSTVDAAVCNSGVERYRALAGTHLTDIAIDELSDNAVLVGARTTQSRIPIAVAIRTEIWRDRRRVDAGSRLAAEPGTAGHVFSTDIVAGEPLTVEKVATIFTGHDRAISAPEEAARSSIGDLGRYHALFDEHRIIWSQLWQAFDFELSGPVDSLRTLNLHIMHLLQSVSAYTADADAGVPARGLHGEAYRGHIFWDELFVIPLLTLRLPRVSRALLGYRHRRLERARRTAAAAGYAGAMYPWQSGSDGREESQQLHLNPLSGRWNPDPSHLAHHIGSAVAYNVWHYYQITGDRQYLLDYGAEVIIEIARFWCSRSTFDSHRGRYVINGVIGPDEFHSGYPGDPHRGVDNNAYTNVMAVWVLLRALDVLDVLPLPDRLDLLDRLRITRDELTAWQSVSRRMFVPFHDGVISQFEGYELLRELDWDRYRRRYGNIGRLDRILEAENDDVNNYRAAKQADVLMLFYLLSADELRELFTRLGYHFRPHQIPATTDYYTRRTSHGSTLSAVVHSWVLARGDREQAMRYFDRVLDSDVADTQGGSTTEGIHLAAMAGSIDLLQRCFSGLETRGDRLVLGPMWPETAGTLRTSLWYRGHRLHLVINGRTAVVTADPTGAPDIEIECRGRVQLLSSGQRIHVS